MIVLIFDISRPSAVSIITIATTVQRNLQTKTTMKKMRSMIMTLPRGLEKGEQKKTGAKCEPEQELEKIS